MCVSDSLSVNSELEMFQYIDNLTGSAFVHFGCVNYLVLGKCVYPHMCCAHLTDLCERRIALRYRPIA